MQREFTVLQEHHGANVSAYRQAQSEGGSTSHQTLTVLERAVFGGSILDPSVMTRPELNDCDVGHPVLTWASRP